MKQLNLLTNHNINIIHLITIEHIRLGDILL